MMLKQSFKYRFLFLCTLLCLAGLVRAFLVIRTYGVIDGDEALVGIQAQHILRGEWPVYFYGIPYFGSLEAYFIALLFTLFGSSVWTLRAEPLVMSLLLVWLSWRCADVLADRAKLSPRMHLCFVGSSTLVAAIAPLYDAVVEMRTWGGHIEIYVVMLGLLLAILRLMDRWQAGVPGKELALRWAGIGFLVGLGLWIYPLVISAVITSGLWVIAQWVPLFRMGRRALVQESLLVLVAIPTALVGFLPGLVWGAQNQWANLTFIAQQGNTQPLGSRIHTLWDVSKLYRTCIAPEVLGGHVPLETRFLATIHQVLTYGAVVGIGGVAVFLIASVVARSSLTLSVRRLAALPLLFAICTIAIFCASSSATNGLGLSCDTDFVGRYAVPIAIVSPFLVGAVIVGLVGLFNGSRILQGAVIALYLLYLVAQAFPYTQTSPSLTFQSPYCLDALANDDPVIAYLEHEHIRYAWATNFVGNPITFKTGGQVLAVDPSGIMLHQAWLNRIPADTNAVEQADRPSVMQLISSDDRHPLFLQQLDQAHITYRVVRFPSEPGIDLLVVTPLNRSIPILTASAFSGMFVCQK